tara:strand:- start:98 stop:301 length:204 start_codon:yes stop_codon:yes gene_type:complete
VDFWYAIPAFVVTFQGVFDFLQQWYQTAVMIAIEMAVQAVGHDYLDLVIHSQFGNMHLYKFCAQFIA